MIGSCGLCCLGDRPYLGLIVWRFVPGFCFSYHRLGSCWFGRKSFVSVCLLNVCGTVSRVWSYGCVNEDRSRFGYVGLNSSF